MDTQLEPSPTSAPRRRAAFWLSNFILLCAFFLAGWLLKPAAQISPADTPAASNSAHSSPAVQSGTVTNIFAHNLRLHQGPSFRVYVQWLRGQLVAARKHVAPSFDDTESFYLNVTNGVIRANIGDVCNFLNSKSQDEPLRDIKIGGTGSDIKITGTLHKLISIPVELTGAIKPVSGNRIQIHITKINILKLPFKSVLSGLHLTLSSFVKSSQIPGMEVTGNDIYFQPDLLLPAPHIKGTLTNVSFAGPDLQALYGDSAKDVERVEQWRNFLRLQGGNINFGKLTMNNVDLIMIDISQDPWFDLDLANYQAQLVNGYTRMTPQAGLQIFMPDLSNIKVDKATNVGIEWFKNRNAAPPAEVQPHK